LRRRIRIQRIKERVAIRKKQVIFTFVTEAKAAGVGSNISRLYKCEMK
jgi:hypothetical protein